jgi:hypothetical protein
VKSAALPPASGEPEQVPFFQTSTWVAPPLAVPFTFGLLSFAGDPGLVDVIEGALGGVESSVYASDEEQAEGLPAASTAFVEKVVVVSPGTVTAMPAPVNCATVSVTSAVPLQVPFFQTFTLTGDPPPTVPLTRGELSFAGDAGTVAPIVGASGGVESST